MNHDAWNSGFDDFFASFADKVGFCEDVTIQESWNHGYRTAAVYRDFLRLRRANPRDTEISDIKEHVSDEDM